MVDKICRMVDLILPCNFMTNLILECTGIFNGQIKFATMTDKALIEQASRFQNKDCFTNV